MQIHAPSTLPPFFRVQKAIYRALPCINYYQLRINKRPISKKFYLVHGLTDNHNDRWMRIFREIHFSVKRFVHVERDYLIDVQGKKPFDRPCTTGRREDLCHNGDAPTHDWKNRFSIDGRNHAGTIMFGRHFNI